MNQEPRVSPDLCTLVRLFYDDPLDLARFEEVEPLDAPPGYRKLLAHNEHMTVTVEAFHNGPVDVQVLQSRTEGDVYAREILLTRKSDGAVVQYGIVRIHFSFLDENTRQEILQQSAPLGHILIKHNVLREVQLQSLWKIMPGNALRKLVGRSTFEKTFGRTAMIYCNGEPAIELLEIVTPVKGE